jgi:predicted restriction endonuclease
MPRKRKSSTSVSDVILGKDFKNPFETSDKPKRTRAYVNKKEVKKFFGNKCKLCGKTEKEVGTLQMAHYKAHSRGGKLVFPLCPTCHTRYDKGLLTKTELNKLNLKREEYKKYQPKKRKAKKQTNIFGL